MPVSEEKLEQKTLKNDYLKEQAFFEDLKDFIVQCIGGIVLNIINPDPRVVGVVNKIPDCNFLAFFDMMVKQYLNRCWHGYGKKNDPFVIKHFDKALSHNLVKGKVCLIMRIDVYSVVIAQKLNLAQLKVSMAGINRDIQRQLLYILIEGLYNNLVLPFEKIKCIGTCDDSYNGEDLFIFGEEANYKIEREK